MNSSTILIVEDDAILAMNLERMLTLQGHTVSAMLASGEDALAFLEKEKVDLVLMDIELAGIMNGITAAEIINRTSDIPIVFLTGFSHDPLLQQAKMAAPYGYLIKPVPERELAATLEMALHRHSLDRKLKESQAALKKSEAQYRHLFENSPLGIFRTTLGGQVLAVNAEMTKIFGCDTPEEVFRDFTDLAKQFYVDPHRRREFISQLRANEIVQHFECEIKQRTGSIIWISISAKLTQNVTANGQRDAQIIDGFAMDITERKRIEAIQTFLAQTSTGTSDAPFFNQLAEFLAQSLQMDFVCIDYLEGDGLSARTVAVWHDGHFEDNVTYALKDTPCGEVVENRVCCYPASVCQFFPEDQVLQDLKAESYVGTTLFSHTGQPIGLIAIIGRTPIVNRSLAETTLAMVAIRAAGEMERLQAEQQYKTLFHEMLDGFALHEIICDQEGNPVDYRFLAVNPAFERMTGLKATDLVGRTVLEVLPQTEPHWIATYGQVALTGKPFHFENYSVDLQKYFEVSAFQPMPNTFACTFIDITERMRAGEALRESEQNFRTLSNSGQALIWTSGTDKLCDYFNTIWLAFTGRTIEQEMGNGWTEGVHPDDMQRCLDIYVGAFDRRENFSMVYRLRRYDGAYRWLLDDGCPRYDSKGKFIGYIGHCLDISEYKQAEEDKKLLQAQLIQAQKMEAIGTLAGGIAHDFNNILGAIIGYTDIAVESIPPDSIAVGYLEKVSVASQRAASLVKQILAFSRQANTEDVALQPAVIIKEAIKILRPSLPSTITIKHQIDSATKSILADPSQVHQILMNLCTNAYHAMEERGGILDITLENCELSNEDLQNQIGVSPGSFVVLIIGDSGPGITAEIRDKIFEPYFTTKEIGKGTGMGLAIVHGIIKRYGGFITCETVLGKGTVFRVYFPSMDLAVTAPVKTVENIPSGKERILFIDDEEILVDLGKTVLERLGYEVTVRTSSIEAWNTFRNQPDLFDVVITDQTMPGLTGSDLALKMLQLRPKLPIILCTGYSSLISEEKAKSMGIKGFAMKPLVRNEIALLLRKLLINKFIN